MENAKSLLNIDLLNEFMDDNKLSRTAFCRLCRISTMTLRKIYNNDYNFDIIALFRIARILNVQISDLFNKN